MGVDALHGCLVSAWCWRARSGQDARGPRQAIPGRSRGAGRSPLRLARSATPIRQRWTSTTVRGSVGASPSRSGYGESTFRWECSPSSISERIVAIPPAHPWLTPADPRIIVILGLDPRNQACVYRKQFSCIAAGRVSRGDAPSPGEWIPALSSECPPNATSAGMTMVIVARVGGCASRRLQNPIENRATFPHKAEPAGVVGCSVGIGGVRSGPLCPCCGATALAHPYVGTGRMGSRCRRASGRALRRASWCARIGGESYGGVWEPGGAGGASRSVATRAFKPA